MEELRKTAQEDVPRGVKKSLPSKNPARTNPVSPDPTTFPELSPSSILSTRDSFSKDKVPREASEDDIKRTWNHDAIQELEKIPIDQTAIEAAVTNPTSRHILRLPSNNPIEPSILREFPAKGF